MIYWYAMTRLYLNQRERGSACTVVNRLVVSWHDKTQFRILEDGANNKHTMRQSSIDVVGQISIEYLIQSDYGCNMRVLVVMLRPNPKP